MSNKFLLTRDSNAATNPLEEDLDANGHSVCNVNQLKFLSLSGNTTNLQAGDNVSPSYTVELPNDPPSIGDVLEITAGGSDWVPYASGGGFVSTSVVPVVDLTIPVYDNTSGNLIKETNLSIDANGDMQRSGVDYLHTKGGVDNMFVGVNSASSITTGIDNTGVGDDVLGALTEGSNNIAIGSGAGSAITTTDDNIYIGSPGLLGESEVIRIGNDAVHSDCFIAGIHGQVPFGAPQTVIVDTAGEMGSVNSGVFGPVSSLDHAVARFDSISGNLIQSSTVTLDDAGGFESTDPINITSTDTNSGPMTIQYTGAANNDLEMKCTSGSVNITSGENSNTALLLDSTHTGGGVCIFSGLSGLQILNTGLNEITGNIFQVNTTSSSASAIDLDTTNGTGGIRLLSDAPILLSHGGGFSNGIDLLCSDPGQISQTSYENHITTTNASADSWDLDCTSGGAIINTNFSCVINGTTIISAGGIGVAVGEDITLVDAKASFVRGASGTHTNLTNSVTTTTSHDIQLPSVVGVVNDILTCTAVPSAGVMTTEWVAGSGAGAQFSGFITGVIPTALANVCSIFVVDGETVFDITPAGDVLNKDLTDPQNIIYTIKTIPEMLNITATELGQTGVTTFYVYVDTRSTPITVSDVIQRITPPSEKNPFEVYLGNIDLRDGASPPNDVIQRHNQFSESAYAHPDTSNTLLFNRGRYNLTGCLFSAFSTTLEVTHSVGTAVRLAVNTVNDLSLPDTIETPDDEISISRYQHFDNTDWQVTTETNRFLIPGMWNDGGTLDTVANNAFTIQYIYFFFGSNSCRFQYGDVEYGTLALAEANLQSAPRIENPAVGEAVLRAAVVLAWNCTDLTDGTKAKFFDLSN